eukprot:m.23046 g.23046  ORF g.23046 m.23046 type:complete len:128 (+) comp8445_c0_seq1:966-1349(+)
MPKTCHVEHVQVNDCCKQRVFMSSGICRARSHVVRQVEVPWKRNVLANFPHHTHTKALQLNAEDVGCLKHRQLFQSPACIQVHEDSNESNLQQDGNSSVQPNPSSSPKTHALPTVSPSSHLSIPHFL